jgi:hypothetical protein
MKKSLACAKAAHTAHRRHARARKGCHAMVSPLSTSCTVRRRSSLPSRRTGGGPWITVPTSMGPAASRRGFAEAVLAQ